MNKARWLFISSGLLYGSAFMVPDYCWHQAIWFLIVALYAGVLGPLGFFDGVLWVVGAHIVPTVVVVASIFEMINAYNTFFALMPALFFFIYWAAIGGMWVFWVNKIVWRGYQKRFSDGMTLVVWGVGWIFYFIWVSDYMFTPLLRQEGSLLWHPLVMVAQMPPLLFLLPVIGLYWYTVLFVSCIGLCVFFALRYMYYVVPLSILVMGGLFFVWWVLLLLGEYKGAVSDLSNQIAVSSFCASVSDVDNQCWIKVLQKELENITPLFCTKGLICTAEGAVDGVNLCKVGQKIFARDVKKIDIMLGTYGIIAGKRYGQLMWVCEGIVKDIYCKTHTLPFLEEIPHWCYVDIFGIIFGGENRCIEASGNSRPQWPLGIGITVTPYICSEFFWGATVPPKNKDIVSLVVVNDNWLVCNYPRKIMWLLARMRAVWWHGTIVYLSPHKATCFDKYGNENSIVIV